MNFYKKLTRQWRWFWQRRFRGFDDRELWKLDLTFAEFIAPRLLAFRDYTKTFPLGLSKEAWDNRLNRMIKAFEIVAASDTIYKYDNEQAVKDGLNLFAEYFSTLWD